MRIGTEFSLPLAPSEAWPLLLDAPTVAACVPGATLLEDLGGNRYRGRASVKLGPVQLEFAGEIAIVEADASDCTATVRARGRITRGVAGPPPTSSSDCPAPGTFLFLRRRAARVRAMLGATIS